MKVKRLVSLALALAVVLSTLCGCGKQEQPDVNDPNEGNKTKDTLIIGHWSDPPSLDPNNALNDCSMRVTTNVFDTLVRMDAHFTPQPCIAESWEISDNQMEYTFKIRNDAKFHNGDLLTVDDVVFSIDRGINSPKASPSFSHVLSATSSPIRWDRLWFRQRSASVALSFARQDSASSALVLCRLLLSGEQSLPKERKSSVRRRISLCSPVLRSCWL